MLLPFVFAALLAYYVVVMPIAYVAYVAVSLPLLAIRDAQATVVVRAGTESVDANDLVDRHIVPMRGFLAGLITTSSRCSPG